MSHANSELQSLLNIQVVIDTDSSYMYIGHLRAIGHDYLTLETVDVHDTKDSNNTKEQYAHEARKLGLRANRRMTYVRLARVLSVSKLDDVLTF